MSRMKGGFPFAARAGVALLFLGLTLLPLAEWVGLPSARIYPRWEDAFRFWLWGTILAGGAGLVVALLAGRWLDAAVQREWARYLAVPDRWMLACLAVWVAGWGFAFTHLLFAGNPNLVDGVSQAFQAKVLASGRLWAQAPQHPEFFHINTMILQDDRWVSQFPPGHAAIVALGLRLGLPTWVPGPLLAAVAAVLTYSAVARSLGRAVARGTALLLATSPFFLFMVGSQMNHATALLFLSAAFHAFVRARESGRMGPAVICGACAGLAFATRPLDAVAWTVPLGAVLVRERRIRSAAAAVAGGLAVAALVFAYNALTTGDPLRFGYGYVHRGAGLGFRTDPWGAAYTPATAWAFLNLDLRRWSLYVFEWPLPVILLTAAGLAFWPRGLDRAGAALIAAAGALLVGNFFYWHHGLYLGPRMLYSALPGALVLTVLGCRALDHRAGRWRAAYRSTLLIAVAMALTLNVPARAQTYASGLATMKLHPDRQARAAGVRDAVIFVKESWTSRMFFRLWAWGLGTWQVERFYRTVDSCEIDSLLQAADRRVAEGADSLATREWLRGELLQRRDDAVGLLPPADTLPDPTVRLAPGRPLSPRCRALIEDDRLGFSSYTPFLWLNAPALDGDLVFARDLGPRDTLLMNAYPGASYYLYAPLRPGSRPELIPLSRAWAARRLP